MATVTGYAPGAEPIQDEAQAFLQATAARIVGLNDELEGLYLKRRELGEVIARTERTRDVMVEAATAGERVAFPPKAMEDPHHHNVRGGSVGWAGGQINPRADEAADLAGEFPYGGPS